MRKEDQKIRATAATTATAAMSAMGAKKTVESVRGSGIPVRLARARCLDEQAPHWSPYTVDIVLSKLIEWTRKGKLGFYVGGAFYEIDVS